MPTAIHPDLLSPEERLDEIAEILSAGVCRLLEKRNAPTLLKTRRNSLDCEFDTSLYGNQVSLQNQGDGPHDD
ncbi:hypothetical protein [Magnetofaba australis]|uniref:Uncharacterized protein n=1 Tax=Magnetofaba australis IT-1 TaxID=1434232 RepID=A0A1Y2K7V2_9PROT|nr:hypothetical protein [Magnetofaba australis]OSM04452.1 hypothetical protein MAIT1_04365 [Magnetofaba australis IT-1]